jgi:hypothetical protein
MSWVSSMDCPVRSWPRPWREELDGKGAPERGKRVLEPEEFEEPEATEA